MVPIVFLIAVTAIVNVESTVAAAIVVSIIYAFANGLFDFGIKWDHKGRKSRGEYRIWTNVDDDDEWHFNTGNVDRLITLYREGRRICYIERSVRVKEGNPYSLGLSLATGALAIDIASVMGGEGLTFYTGYA